MRQMPYIGWTIFSRSSRSEWPIGYFVHGRRRDAIEAFKSGFKDRETGERIYHERLQDGSIRVGKVEVRALP
jgi:hypothetical protein